MARRRPISQLGRDARYRINLAVRKAAVEIMNGLAEAGPVYTGEFRDSWVAIPVGQGASGSVGGGYPYALSQVPQLSLTAREVGRKVKFTIENTSAHAEIALDLEPGYFITPEFERESPMPGNEIISGARSNPSLRWNIDEGVDGEAEISAPRDWYPNYVRGGQMQKNLAQGVRLGFKDDVFLP